MNSSDERRRKFPQALSLTVTTAGCDRKRVTTAQLPFTQLKRQHCQLFGSL
ncbi:MAG: hypothetical protein KME45_06340 [Stenomitos rutilans HA7619-LM2]|nr:hypothetical protein [Stenomitos rutilans HA7619-LM2]